MSQDLSRNNLTLSQDPSCDVFNVSWHQPTPLSKTALLNSNMHTDYASMKC